MANITNPIDETKNIILKSYSGKTSLQDFEWSGVYCSADMDLFKKFYTPVLAAAVQYDRAVGFFSAEALVSNLNGLSCLVKNDGRMRLVIGHPLEEDEFAAVRSGYRLNELIGDLEKELDLVIREMRSVGEDKLSLMAYMISEDRLEIKYALRKKGMYHEKIGVVHDAYGNRIVFHGSPNETMYGLGGGFNAESISVYTSWDEKIYGLYGAHYEKSFEQLWCGQYPNTVTLDVPSRFYEEIVKASPVVNINAIDEVPESYRLEEFFGKELKFNYPRVPERLGDREFSIKSHQREAVRSWINSGYKGILKLSTGSGKTISALYAVTRVYEARLKYDKKTVLIVSVPYQELARQWTDNLKLFNISPIKCWQSRSLWRADLEKEILDYKLGVTDFLSLVVVNRTMESSEFGRVVDELPSQEMFFIGDECHNHGSKKTNCSLPDAYYRLGLSATPYRSDDDEVEMIFPDEAKMRINEYYKGVVAEYSLGDAINDGVLCEYDYYIIPVYLTSDEQEEYESLSNEIARIIASSGGSVSSEYKNEFTRLCGMRSRLLGSARNKMSELGKICELIPKEKRKNSLFYCGEGRFLQDDSNSSFTGVKIIEEVSSVLSDCGWHTSRFTSEESPAERTRIMQNFVDGSIDALVSMKVLDEGVDVPVCDKAFILASTRNPRQYIQRRGRILRRHDEKTHAEIYDFVILPISDSPASIRLKQAELERVDDFVLLARNRYEVERNIENIGLRGKV